MTIKLLYFVLADSCEISEWVISKIDEKSQQNQDRNGRLKYIA